MGNLNYFSNVLLSLCPARSLSCLLSGMLNLCCQSLLCLLLISCGGGSSDSALSVVNPPVVNPPPVLASNEVAIIVDKGPSASKSTINQAYVSVTICRPATTVCQTIDHILLDTASIGLRLIAPNILDAQLQLPAVKLGNGALLAECVQFASGYQWGAVRQASVKIGGESIATLPVHIVADASSEFAKQPLSCQSSGLDIGSVAALGANGVLGVGLFKEDCGEACVSSVIPGAYYACDAISCRSISVPLLQQVANPVSSFAQNNNGVLVLMPSVGLGGVTQLNGSLIFGIGTQTNNLLSAESIYATDSRGNFITIYNNKALSSSFIDSGSNGYYFDDKAIKVCTLSTSFYCPAAALNLSAVNKSFDSRTSGIVNFRLEATDGLNSGTIAAHIGGAGSGFSGSFNSNSFDWGLPFFFGRRVFVAIKDANTAYGKGPYWAY
ncbi:DUF3443 domain-containing protein [Undibacterium parvum]|uniref:DUF3443 domain-containing protein n=1 Tax=Undibacterium parvum TaxID=401471 RepID=A0A3Q9BSK9_9BURK|nr:DUF3443 domain-containing protein [Undibacterium parvum]AZP13415.1 DUF3443 domain-containing protein [Undibacterium parvum]